MLLALLLPDPCDPHCPCDFKSKAREILRPIPGSVGKTDDELRDALLRFIGDFADWDHSAHATFLEAGRALVKAAHPAETPVVVDPFAGGGSIPLEALRLGCDTIASDINPVACLILKTMLEDIPRHGQGLADELRRVGMEIKSAAEQELAQLYPSDVDGARPIAYLWARTVQCEAPNCGAELPLIRSYWLSKKPIRRRALRSRIVRPRGQAPRIEFEIFEPSTEKEVPAGTVIRARARCLACGAILSPDRVRAQLSAQRGGTDVLFDAMKHRSGGARMLAVVTLRKNMAGRHYRLPTDEDLGAVRRAHDALSQLSATNLANGLPVVPNEAVVQQRVAKNSPFRFHLYGCDTFGALCTARQKVALLAFARNIREVRASEAVRELLALVLDRVASRSSSLSSWRYQADQEKVEHMFVRQALSIEWDFAESVPISKSTGSFHDGIDVVALCVESLARSVQRPGQALRADAASSPIPDHVANVWFTDPPYYDAVPYSDLSDYFFIWLKRALPGHPLLGNKDEPSNPLTPKAREARMDEAREVDGIPKDRAFFESAIAKAFSESRRLLPDGGIGCVIFAHKTTEGWEALISGLIGGGWTVTGSWPIATEMGSRLRARESAALATSVHLVCRPRAEDKIGDWGEVLRELPGRVAEWMARLEREGVRGADLVFACIGPALEIFSRYSRVETADGREAPLARYLEKVWEIVGRTALRRILGTDTPADFGEDARLTALFLWAMQAANGSNGDGGADSLVGKGEAEEAIAAEDTEHEGPITRRAVKGYALPFDIVRRIAQPLGIHLDRWNRRLIDIDKGTVRLLPISSRTAFLVEPDVAHDLALLQPHWREKPERQLRLFDDAGEGERRANAARARETVEQRTWSQLHLDSISTLDHVHKAMLFQKQGATGALRELLFYEKHYRPEFVPLANALAALYPKESEEKRLLDAMLLALPR
jgi:adenine-specific DNA methylase